MELLLWQNLIFLLPVLLAVLYLLVLGTAGHDAGHHDIDGIGHDAGGHHDGGSHGDSDVDAQHSFDPSKVLRLFGIGRVPLSLVIVTALLLWGGAGLVINQIFGIGRIMETMALAGLACFFGTGSISNFLGNIIQTRSYHVPREHLVGKTATATYRITAESGEVRLTDSAGTLRDLPARIGAGENEIQSDTEVVLARYDNDRGVFIAKPVRS